MVASGVAMHSLDERLLILYKEKKKEIEERLIEFLSLKREADDKRLFEELAFCTLTPQAKPIEAQKTLDHLMHLGLLWKGSAETISPHLHRVRFRHTKAFSLVYNRNQCFSAGWSLREKLESLKDAFAMRRWLVETMRGIGWKEASHFLRNTGFGLELAILDRHVLRMLAERFGIVIPSSLSGKRYEEYERLLGRWADSLSLSMAVMDFLIFYEKTGVIFK
ncbi:MAG: DNA lyase [Brevinematales bacterium]